MNIEEKMAQVIHRSKTEVTRSQSQLPDTAVDAAVESWLGATPDVSPNWHQRLWHEMRLAINRALDVILPISTGPGILAAIDKRIKDTGGLQDNAVLLKFSELEVLRQILGQIESGKNVPLGYARPSQIVRVSQEDGTTLSVTDEPCGYCTVPIYIYPPLMNFSDAYAQIAESLKGVGYQSARPPSADDARDAGHASIELTGAEILEAARFVIPDWVKEGDATVDVVANQLETPATIARNPPTAPPGLWIWLSEYPDEGAQRLDDEADRARGDSNG